MHLYSKILTISPGKHPLYVYLNLQFLYINLSVASKECEIRTKENVSEIFGQISSSSIVFDRWILLASDRKLCVGLSSAPEVTARRHTDHATISRFLDCVLFHVKIEFSAYIFTVFPTVNDSVTILAL